MLEGILSDCVYLICFVVSWYALSSINYEKALKKNHVLQAQVLYILVCVALAYLSGSFLLAFVLHF